MRTWRLVVETTAGSRELLFIGQMTAGRAAECDISLDDGKVSRRHASFDATGPTPRVTDLNSRNGILVNNRRVTTADLSEGDVVIIGDARVRLELITEASEPRTIAHGMRPDADGEPDGAPLVLDAEDDRTAVLPRPVPPRASGPRVPGPAGSAREDDTAVLTPPVPRRPTPVMKGAGDDSGAARPPVAVQYVAEPPQPVSPATQADVQAPRPSWATVVMLATLALALLTVALTSIPLMSASTEAVDDLGRRQARTLAAWLAGSVGPEDPPSRLDATLQNVLGQPGVRDGLVLDLATRRIVAPSRLAAESRAQIGAAEGDWSTMALPQVLVGSGVVDAYAPVSVGPARYLAWVRYEVPTSSDRALVLLVAVLGAALMGVAASTWIRRHTSRALATFTRQVEIAVSGGDPRTMQGTLLPGLDKLPPVVSYLLEQRRTGFDAGRREHSPLGVTDAQRPTPAWIEMTPTLSVVSTSPHVPPFQVRAWGAEATDRHLLDVLEPGIVCNAVVMALSGLAPPAGSEVAVPVDGHPRPMVLRREASGHLRLAIPPGTAGGS